MAHEPQESSLTMGDRLMVRITNNVITVLDSAKNNRTVTVIMNLNKSRIFVQREFAVEW
jgi:hypothetical protein